MTYSYYLNQFESSLLAHLEWNILKLNVDAQKILMTKLEYHTICGIECFINRDYTCCAVYKEISTYHNYFFTTMYKRDLNQVIQFIRENTIDVAHSS